MSREIFTKSIIFWFDNRRDVLPLARELGHPRSLLTFSAPCASLVTTFSPARKFYLRETLLSLCLCKLLCGGKHRAVEVCRLVNDRVIPFTKTTVLVDR